MYKSAKYHFNLCPFVDRDGKPIAEKLENFRGEWNDWKCINIYTLCLELSFVDPSDPASYSSTFLLNVLY